MQLAVFQRRQTRKSCHFDKCLFNRSNRKQCHSSFVAFSRTKLCISPRLKCVLDIENDGFNWICRPELLSKSVALMKKECQTKKVYGYVVDWTCNHSKNAINDTISLLFFMNL